MGSVYRVDRLSLYKLLADGSRYSIYQELAGADGALSTADISRRLKLHPNTVRLHLEKMREAGLVESASEHHGSVGRPQHVWTTAGRPPPLDPEPAGFRLLAHLLADLATRSPLEPGAAADAGRRRASERTGRRKARRAGSVRATCLDALVGELDDLGFDPVVEGGGTGAASISFTRCPFRELAALYPDVVCELHRGLTQGIAEASAEKEGAGARLESFSSLVDEDPCRAEVSFAPV